MVSDRELLSLPIKNKVMLGHKGGNRNWVL